MPPLQVPVRWRPRGAREDAMTCAARPVIHPSPGGSSSSSARAFAGLVTRSSGSGSPMAAFGRHDAPWCPIVRSAVHGGAPRSAAGSADAHRARSTPAEVLRATPLPKRRSAFVALAVHPAERGPCLFVASGTTLEWGSAQLPPRSPESSFRADAVAVLCGHGCDVPACDGGDPAPRIRNASTRAFSFLYLANVWRACGRSCRRSSSSSCSGSAQRWGSRSRRMSSSRRRRSR